MPVIAEFLARETQDFASLQADAILMLIPKPSASKSICKILRLTSNICIHPHHIISRISLPWFACETQNFASLLGGNAFTVSDIIACACGMEWT